MTEEKKLTPKELIDKDILEREKALKEVSDEAQKARDFLAQAEPQIYALKGAITSLKELKVKL